MTHGTPKVIWELTGQAAFWKGSPMLLANLIESRLGLLPLLAIFRRLPAAMGYARSLCSSLLIACLLSAPLPSVVAQDSLGQSEISKMSARIDWHIQQQFLARGIEKGPLASDAEFLRRAYLDLTGVNPDAALAVDYLKNSDPAKRKKMLEGLVNSSGFSVRLADTWTELLLPDSSDFALQQQRESLRRWLLDRFADNARYDRIVADLLISTGDPNENPTAFFTSLELKPEKLAERTSRVFLGVALDCAQCHDHPFDTWKQTDFWGVAAYFARVKAQGDRIADAEQGEVQIPETTTPIFPKPLLKNVESSLGIGSRRQQLAIWVTSKQNSWFARAAVNRVWAMLMGRGIVEPVDDMGSKSIPAYPELLDELSIYFQRSGYDLRSLILAIAQSDTYAASSQGFKESPEEIPFSTMRPKPLTSKQIASSLRHAARDSSQNGPQDVWGQIATKLGSIRGDSSEYTGGVLQSLLLQNSAETAAIWEESTSRLLKAVHAPHISPEKRLDWIYLATLARYPTDRERERIQTWMKSDDGTADSERLWQGDLLWAIINSTEFGMTP